MKKRIIALLLLTMLMVGLLPGAQAAGALFFVGVNNDIPVLLSGDTSPFYANGMLYAPYTVFSAGPGGVNVSYDVDQETFALFTLSNTVVYDLAEGTMTTKSGSSIGVDVIYRNGILYLPVEQAASQFGLTVSLITSKTGCALLRFKDGTEVYDDQTFLEKSELFISHMLDTYGSQPLGEEIVSEEEQSPSGDEEEPAGAVEAYLAFAGDAVSQSTLGHLDAMEYLSDTEIYCTFFLTAEQIMENPQLVRDIYSGGHTIGLTVAQDEADAEDALRRANEVLDAVLFCRTVLALLPGSETEPPSYRICWQSQTVDTVEAALEYTQMPALLVCRSDVAATLEQLSVHGVSILQLLETTVLEERTEEAS